MASFSGHPTDAVSRQRLLRSLARHTVAGLLAASLMTLVSGCSLLLGREPTYRDGGTEPQRDAGLDGSAFDADVRAEAGIDAAAPDDAASPLDGATDGGTSDAGPTVDGGTPIRCPSLSPPLNGSVEPMTGSPGDVATYTCDAGRVLTGNGGSSIRVCQADGSWTGSDPSCEEIVSPCVPNPCLNGGTCNATGTTFECECAQGFEGATCATRTPCSPALTPPPNGSVDRTTGATGDVATYTCDGGYTLVGGATRMCQATGAWSGSPPTCRPNPCTPNLVSPLNGSVDRTSGVTGDVATYSCNPGYTLSGARTRSCQTSGTWSGTAPTCTANACSPDLTPPTNGSVDRTTGTTGEVATYTCNLGYQLAGEPTRTCQTNGVWSGSAPSCPGGVWVVGEGGTILTWNGSTWRSVTSPTSSDLLGIWGPSADTAWAVGAGGTIIRWASGSWTHVASGSTATLRGIWGTSASNAWAVGDSGTILRWNGSTWASVTSGTTATLTGVWGTSANDIWAIASNGTILRWTGTSWGSVTSGTSNYLYGIWANSTSNGWTVGNGCTIRRWNGSSWTSTTCEVAAFLFSIWGSASNDIWIVGSSGTILRWNGSTWTPATSGTSSSLLRVRGTSSSNAWAVGNDGTILRWNGTDWRATASGTTAWLRDVWQP